MSTSIVLTSTIFIGALLRWGSCGLQCLDGPLGHVQRSADIAAGRDPRIVLEADLAGGQQMEGLELRAVRLLEQGEVLALGAADRTRRAEDGAVRTLRPTDLDHALRAEHLKAHVV